MMSRTSSSSPPSSSRHWTASPRRAPPISSPPSPNPAGGPSRVFCLGLGIRHVGSTAAQLLARHFGTLDALADAPEEEIVAVRGIGAIIARAVVAFFADKSARKLIEKLRRAKVNFSEPRSVSASGALKGLTVVITGTLPSLSRDRATELIEQAGGRVTSSVSKATNLLVAGAEAGSKLEKARSLGTDIIDEAELLRRIGGAQSD